MRSFEEGQEVIDFDRFVHLRRPGASHKVRASEDATLRVGERSRKELRSDCLRHVRPIVRSAQRSIPAGHCGRSLFISRLLADRPFRTEEHPGRTLRPVALHFTASGRSAVLNVYVCRKGRQDTISGPEPFAFEEYVLYLCLIAIF